MLSKILRKRFNYNLLVYWNNECFRKQLLFIIFIIINRYISIVTLNVHYYVSI